MQLKYQWPLIVCLPFLVSTTRSQPVLTTLDLTETVPCQGSRSSGSGSGGGVGYRGQPPPPVLPLALRLIDVKPRPLRWLNRVVYEIELENVGTRTVILPWASECEVSMEDANLVTVGISLVLRSGSDSQVVAFAAIYGSKMNAATTRAITPGEKVRIRLAAVVSGRKNLLKNLPGELEVTVNAIAEFTFVRGPERDHAPLKSSNVVALEVVRPDEY